MGLTFDQYVTFDRYARNSANGRPADATGTLAR